MIDYLMNRKEFKFHILSKIETKIRTNKKLFGILRI